MIRIVVFYLAIQLNGLLVSLYLKEYLTIEGIVLLQLVLLSVTCLEIARHKTLQAKKNNLKQSSKMVASWFCGYGCFCSLHQFPIFSAD